MLADLNVKVDATASGYETAIARAEKATLSYDLSLKRLESDLMALERELDGEVTAALERQHDAMDKTGRAAFVFGAAVVAGIGMATAEAVKWESAWAGVTKTVNGSASEMDALQGQLRGLATTLPATHEEIAGVAEAAGQLGVQRQNIAAFTKTMIDLGETTNLSADEAATSIAQLMNVMKTTPDKVDEIGSTLVALGNAGASTEKDILSLSLRLSGIGALTGMTEADILGLASAMADLGIESELGGGAASRVITKMYENVKNGGPRLDALAQTAGMTSDAFVKAFGEDPIRAFDAFNQGLGRVKDSGGNVIEALSQIGVVGTQNLQVMLRLAGSGDGLTTSLDRSVDAWEANNALLQEAEKRYGTTESKIAIARNTLRDSAIDVGNTVLPAIAGLADVVASLSRTWSDLPGPMKQTVTILGLVAGAVALTGGAALIAVPKVAAFQAAVNGLQAGALKSAGTRLMGMGSILAGPWGIAIAGGVAALGLFAARHGEAAREVDALKATLDEQTGAITENSRQWAIKKLMDEGVLQQAKNLGLDLTLVTDAALGQAGALSSVNAELDRLISGGTEYTAMGPGSLPFAKDAKELQGVLSDTNGTLGKSREEWELQKEALGGAAEATGKAGDAQKGTTGAWEDGAAAAGDLTEEVKTLGELMAELSGEYLDNREAGRQVRSSLRSIRDEVRDYRKEHDGLKGAFREGSKSGDEFAAMLDGLAGDYQRQIEMVEKSTLSEKKVREAYRESRASLIEVAMQLKMTRREAEDYADQVLGTPSDITTHFNTPGLAGALTQVATFASYLRGLPAEKRTQIIATKVNRIVNQGWSENGLANGGVVTAYANGGVAADGGAVPRVPQIASGRDIRWAEPETGWEAYISGKPGMGARNRDVWLEAGRRLGMVGAGANMQQLFVGAGRSFASGGFAGSGGGGGQVVVVREAGPLIGSLTVPAMPGATTDDAHTIVGAIVREVGLAQRSGRWAQED